MVPPVSVYQLILKFPLNTLLFKANESLVNLLVSFIILNKQAQNSRKEILGVGGFFIRILNYSNMNHSEKTREELIYELSKLTRLLDEARQKYEEEILIARQDAANARKSEEIFRKAFLVSPDSVNINRLHDGMYVSVNEGFVKILGFAEEEVLGRSSLDFNIWVDPVDRRRMVSELEKSGKIENFEADFRRKDGRVINGSMSGTLIDIGGVPHILNITKDITGIKLIKKELEQERSLIDALINNLTDYIYIKDREGKFLKINKSQASLLGLNDPEEVLGKSDRDFYSDEHANAGYEDEEYVVNTGKVVSKEEKLTRKGLDDIWVLTTKTPLMDLNGKIIGSFGISRDITEKKNLEDSLHLKQIMLEAIIDNSPDQIYYKNRNSKFMLCNKAVALLAGCESEKEMIGKSDFDFYPPELAQQYFNEEQNLMDRGELMLDHEEPVINKITGEKLWNLSSKVPVRNVNGEVIGMAGFNRDITERKRSELENQVLYEIMKGITSTSNLEDLLALIHKSLSRIVYADNCFVAFFNQKSGTFSFPYFVDKLDTVPEPSAMLKSCTAYVFRHMKPFLFSQKDFDSLAEQDEVELVGSPSPSWIGIPLQTHSRKIGVLVLQHYIEENIYTEKDVKILMSIGRQIAVAIERKMSEEEIRIKSELLEALNAEKDKFFSILAHDLRGPLSAFVEATRIIEEDIQNMTYEDIKDIIISMKSDATNVYRLLENLLEWSRLKRGGMEFAPVILNLKSTINSVTETVSSQAATKGVDIDVIINDTMEINADPHMFGTIIRNLISNAIKFTPGPGKISVSAIIINEGEIEISVADSGIGMSQDLKSKLFLITEKTGRKGTDGEPSSGLGLLLCKDFIEKNGGLIRVESEEGKGSTFSFTMPAVRVIKN